MFGFWTYTSVGSFSLKASSASCKTFPAMREDAEQSSPSEIFFSPRSFCFLVLLLLIFCFDFPTDALYSNIWNFDFSCISTKKHVQVQLARNLLPVCKNFRFLVTFPTPYPLPSLSSTLPLLYTVRSVQALSHSGILFSGVYITRLHAQKNKNVSILISPLETSHGSWQ